MDRDMEMYFMGGKGIEKPVDFNDIEIKEGDILSNDNFDDVFNDDFYEKHFPKWTKQDIEKRKHNPTYIVKKNLKGFFYGEGINQKLYLHDFRFRHTKVIKKSSS